VAKDEGISSFAVLITQFEDGYLNDDLSEKVKALASTLGKHAEHFGKAKGELHLVLKLNVDAGGTVSIDTEIKVKEPKVVRPRTLMWLTKNNTLSPANPKQQELPGLREAPQVKTAPRDVAAPKDA
jgi:hypothetical protein